MSCLGGTLTGWIRRCIWHSGKQLSRILTYGRSLDRGIRRVTRLHRNNLRRGIFSLLAWEAHRKALTGLHAVHQSVDASLLACTPEKTFSRGFQEPLVYGNEVTAPSNPQARRADTVAARYWLCPMTAPHPATSTGCAAFHGQEEPRRLARCGRYDRLVPAR